MLAELRKKLVEQAPAKCVRKCVFEEETRMHDEDISAKFVKSGALSEEFCRTLSVYDKSQSRIRISQNEVCVLY